MASVNAGDVVADKYRVERTLGSGGMGFVVAARHLALDQLVAIKFLTKSDVCDVSDDEAYARFRHEAKAASGLSGDHVTKVFDVGVHEDVPFIVMEYLEGADLGAVARERGAFALAEAVDWVLQTCEALAEAHARGLVHRDLKLANLFLTRAPSGAPFVKLLDFGVARSIDPSGGRDVTRTSMTIGSPRYMSPEQMNDPRRVDARSDLWSLGICLYRLVAGQFPFDGEIGRIYTMVQHEPPPPISRIRGDVPPAFDAVVGRCLEKDRERRYANVAELAGALVPFAADVDRARDVVAQIAAVLEVPVPSFAGGTAILEQATQAMMVRTHPSLGGAAWTHEAPRETAPARRVGLTLAMAAATLAVALAVVGAVVLARSRARLPVAEAATLPTIPAAVVPSAALAADAAAPLAPPPPSALTIVTPPEANAPTSSPPRPRASSPAPVRRAPAKPAAATLPIPGDRK